MIPRLIVDNSELLAVPAVHHRAVFAELVHRVCHSASSRPEAIAVELCQDAVLAVQTWLAELGVGKGSPGRIPCMLGLTKQNRRIHPRLKATALRLQELHGVPLHQIAPEILRRELNYSPAELLCLSTTDSMIEAIRSAMELGIPIYGVDLGDIGTANRGHPLLQDPLQAQRSLVAYVDRNAPLCSQLRDPIIDDRREWTMAARLRRLLRDYRRVLFTCGIGHWHLLKARLLDPAQPTANEPAQAGLATYARVVVAPSLAIAQMDIFPDITVRYESLRQLPPNAPERRLDYAKVYRDQLARAWPLAAPDRREATSMFAGYLTNLCMVNQSHVPDLHLTLHAARMMISPEFASRLAKILVYESLDWAAPEHWPNLPYLRAAAHDPSPLPEAGPQAELHRRSQKSAPFYFTHASERSDRSAASDFLALSELDPDPANNREILPPFEAWVWPPCETLLFGTAFTAAEIAGANHHVNRTEPFAGALHDGVDVKATLRAQIRGERQVQVKVRSAARHEAPTEAASDEPTVFIFEPAATAEGGDWRLFLAAFGPDMRPYIRNLNRFDQVIREQGGNFVASVHYGAGREPPEALRPHVSDLRYLYGITVYGNPCLTPRQSARWLEAKDYACCPLVAWGNVRSLFELYRCKHLLPLDERAWPASLVLAALPYARQRVTVVLPSKQSLPPAVFREANRRRIGLDLLPLSHFPASQLEKIRHQYLVHPQDVDAMEYPEAMRAAFGESPQQHLELLPERIRAQLRSPY